MAKIYVLPRWGADVPKLQSQYRPYTIVVDTTSNAADDVHSQLSPFKLGPCRLYGKYSSLNMENAWQYAKVYWEYQGKNGGPSPEYWHWARGGWANPKAVRYPMGKGRKPEYSWWKDKPLDYVAARKAIYGPLYAEAVQKTEMFHYLKGWARRRGIVLLDYDAYDHRKEGMNLTEVLNNPRRKMGHAFVLAMLLQRDHALKQMELRE